MAQVMDRVRMKMGGNPSSNDPALLRQQAESSAADFARAGGNADQLNATLGLLDLDDAGVQMIADFIASANKGLEASQGRQFYTEAHTSTQKIIDDMTKTGRARIVGPDGKLYDMELVAIDQAETVDTMPDCLSTELKTKVSAGQPFNIAGTYAVGGDAALLPNMMHGEIIAESKLRDIKRALDSDAGKHLDTAGGGKYTYSPIAADDSRLDQAYAEFAASPAGAYLIQELGVDRGAVLPTTAWYANHRTMQWHLHRSAGAPQQPTPPNQPTPGNKQPAMVVKPVTEELAAKKPVPKPGPGLFPSAPKPPVPPATPTPAPETPKPTKAEHKQPAMVVKPVTEELAAKKPVPKPGPGLFPSAPKPPVPPATPTPAPETPKPTKAEHKQARKPEARHYRRLANALSNLFSKKAEEEQLLAQSPSVETKNRANRREIYNSAINYMGYGIPRSVIEADPDQVASIIGELQELGSGEDAYGKVQGEHSTLFTLSDGMGGTTNGAAASRLTVEAFLQDVGLTNIGDDDKLEDVVVAACEKMKQRIVAAQEKVFQFNVDHNSNSGATVVAAEVIGNRLVYGSVGDSSIFVVRNGKFILVTGDRGGHSNEIRSAIDGMSMEFNAMPEDLLKETTLDELSRLERSGAAWATGRLQVISSYDDVGVFELQDDDRVVLCSDGIMGDWSEIKGLRHHEGAGEQTLTDEQIVAAVGSGSVEEAIKRLIEIAKKGDDRTVEMFDIKLQS
jgi:serine/threonine protein phosphatase PrpC